MSTDAWDAGYAAGRTAALADLRDEHAKALDEARPGTAVDCPVCLRPHRRYRRKLNSGMADVLIRIYRAARGSSDAVVSIEQIFGSRKQDHRDWPLLRHWGLVLPAEKRDGSRNASGAWRLTPLGVAFVEGQLAVPRYVEIRDDVLLGKSDETTTLAGALGNPFDYAELLRGEG